MKKENSMILMPWTKRRLAREAIAAGLDAQQREQTLYALTGWDLDSLNDALAKGDVEIVTSAEAREAIHNMATRSGYSLAAVTEMFQTVWRKQ